MINVLVNCGSGFSFTSSHATNHFGVGLAFILLFGKRIKWFIPAFLFWASSIALAQVYVGVHYPSDIFAGAVLGSLIATIIYGIYHKIPDHYKLGLKWK